MMGSITTIMDEVKNYQEHDLKSGLEKGEFPLYLKSSSANEWRKFEYGLYLLNMNLSQLRWSCNEKTLDLSLTLDNLNGMFCLCTSVFKPIPMSNSMPPLLTKTVFPPVGGRQQVIIKHGRAIISGTGCLSAKRIIPLAYCGVVIHSIDLFYTSN